MKRLRFILWAIAVCITDELEPDTCMVVNPVLAKQHETNEWFCGFEYCHLLKGHRFKHENGYGVSWE